MNMKKTMAAIAACAVAVSAMATTVSAVEDTTLPYDLTAFSKNLSKGNVNVTGTVSGVTPTTGIAVAFTKVPEGYSLNQLTITVKDSAGGAGSKVFNYNADWNSDNYTWLGGNSITIPVEALDASKTYDVTVVANFAHPYEPYGGAAGKVAGAIAAAGTGLTVNATPATQLLASGYVDSTWTKYESPMQTTIGNNYNVIDYLEGEYLNPAGLKMYLNGEDKNFVNVGPVLNDAIRNYETVTFQFNSAKEYVRFEAVVNQALTGEKGASKAVIANKVEAKLAALSTELGELKGAFKEATLTATANATNLDDDGKVISVKYDEASDALKKELKTQVDAIVSKQAEIDSWMDYDTVWYYTTENWDSTDYSKFTQHLYNGVEHNNYFAAEGTDYLGLDWAGYNLFQGGLVINEAYTMSLADTTKFDWGKSSVSFDWDTITDAAASVYNPYALYLHSMELATSVDWYWDSLDVILTAGAVDDATSDAGAETDDEVLDETPVDDEAADEEAADEEITEDEFADEEAADDEVAADDEEAAADDEEAAADDEEAAADDEEAAADDEAEDEAADEEVSNPTTGNASVALAVIPVALAAAAVVAKKRS